MGFQMGRSSKSPRVQSSESRAGPALLSRRAERLPPSGRGSVLGRPPPDSPAWLERPRPWVSTADGVQTSSAEEGGGG